MKLETANPSSLIPEDHEIFAENAHPSGEVCEL
jgi:hypothetical protein